ncbi:MAG: glycosyltransferase [Clostridium sp.]|nr:glycosyltransferase [Clostridium sp.]
MTELSHELLPTACTVLCLVWAVAFYTTFTFARNLRKQAMRRSGLATHRPPLSVVVTAHNQAEQLAHNLPTLLQQDYADYEVIVVNDNSSDNTEDVLTRLELRFPHLRHTFTPASARYISPKRLALTVGIRSASHEWVVLTDANCRPASPAWLSRMAEQMDDRAELVLGYVNHCQPPYYKHGNRMIIYRLYHQLLRLNHTIRHAAPTAEPGNIALKKNLFMQQRGFASHQQLLVGAEELFVNRASTSANTRVCMGVDSVIRQEWPGMSHQWKQDRAYAVETHRHLFHTRLFRLNYNWRMFQPYLTLCVLIAGCLLDPFCPWHAAPLASVTLYLTYIVAQQYVFTRSSRLLGETAVFRTSLLLFRLSLPFLLFCNHLRHRIMPRTAFFKKNI